MDNFNINKGMRDMNGAKIQAADSGTLQKVVSVLSSYSFSLSDEKVLQSEISEVLDKEGIDHRREVSLGSGEIIDFMFDCGVGMEVKIKGQKLAIYRQLRRYSQSEKIQSLILATSISMGAPKEIEGKPVRVFSLSRAHL